MTHKNHLPKAVWVFGVVSFLNDAASEMVTPLIPILITTVLAASPVVLGLIEGTAEATASLLKLLAGRWVDRGASARKLIFAGYGLSNILRPLFGLVSVWSLAFGLRFGDRIGKGLRTAPRDAWIASVTDQSTRGKAFGFHRSMDHLGAFVGPVLAFALLSWGFGIKQVFLLSVIPGSILLVFLALSLLRLGAPKLGQKQKPELASKELTARLKSVLWAVGLLAFGAVPDAFLVLWAQSAGLEVRWIAILWAVAHLARSFVVSFTGRLSDRLGRRPVLVSCWLLRIAGTLVLAWAPQSLVWVWCAFIGFAAAAGSAESVERAIVGDWAKADLKGTSFGWFHMINGLSALPGAVLFAWVWQSYSAETSFLLSAGISLAATFVFARSLNRNA